jgi:hypothetical protein
MRSLQSFYLDSSATLQPFSANIGIFASDTREPASLGLLQNSGPHWVRKQSQLPPTLVKALVYNFLMSVAPANASPERNVWQ